MLGGGVEDVSIVSVVYTRGTVSVSSLCYFLSVGSSSKPSHTFFTISLRARHIQDYLKKKRRRKRKFIKHNRRRP